MSEIRIAVLRVWRRILARVLRGRTYEKGYVDGWNAAERWTFSEAPEKEGEDG